jgi:class 3 adenylate cyclase
VRPLAIVSFLLDSLQRLLNVAVTITVLALLGLAALHLPPASGLSKAVIILRFEAFATPIMVRLGHALHTPPAFMPWMPVALAVAVTVLMQVMTKVFDLLHETIERAAYAARKRAKAPASDRGVDSEKTRAQLFNEYRKIEKALADAKRRQCTFLSIDVVGSTGMKAGESEVAIAATFRAYEQLLKRTFKETHAWKESWTPDGVMICFQHRDDAVRAAQTILTQLLAFNQRENALKTRFEVRCGINEGEVVVFEDSELEKLVEHTIDVAGHMQKYAKPGTLLLSRELFTLLDDQSGFVPTGQEVDSYATYAWTPKPPV